MPNDFVARWCRSDRDALRVVDHACGDLFGWSDQHRLLVSALIDLGQTGELWLTSIVNLASTQRRSSIAAD
jgi:hypothetical protein